jgi:hypothetical protein
MHESEINKDNIGYGDNLYNTIEKTIKDNIATIIIKISKDGEILYKKTNIGSKETDATKILVHLS